MKAICAGVTRQHGNSKKTGKPYDMARVIILQPVEVVANVDFSREGHGYQAVEIDLDAGALPRFASVKFPCELELTTTDRIFMGRIQTVITGYTPSAAQKAAA